jgi:hypothetical protein
MYCLLSGMQDRLSQHVTVFFQRFGPNFSVACVRDCTGIWNQPVDIAAADARIGGAADLADAARWLTEL